jgi:hypothetical protein
MRRSAARSSNSPCAPTTQDFYLHNGFQPVPQCLTYVIAGPALAALAERGSNPSR